MNKIKRILAAFSVLFTLFPAFSYNKNDLIRAIEADSSANVKKILTRNSNLAAVSYNTDKDSILMIAIEHNCSIQVIEAILKAGCSPDIKNAYGKTALMFACKHQSDPRIIDKIICFNALTKSGRAKRCTVKDKDGKTSFDYAGENTTAYKKLLEYASDPAKAVKEEPPAEEPVEEIPEEVTEETAGETPEELAEETEETPEEVAEVTEETVEEDAVEEVTEEPSEEIAEEAVEETAEPEVYEQIAEEPPEVLPAVAVEDEETEYEPEEIEEETEVEEEITEDEEEVTEAEETEEVLQVEPETITVAPASEELPVIDHYNKNRPEYLFDDMDSELTVTAEDVKIKNIPNPDAKDKNGRTRLMNAIIAGDVELCYKLLYSGAKTDARDKDGWTPLMYACRYSDSPDIIALLFSYGSSLNEKPNVYGVTPLTIAAVYCKNEQVMSLIIEHAQNEKLNLTNAFITALSHERPADIIKPFIPHIKNINKLIDGKTALMYAASNYSSTDVIKLLLENGADPYIISFEKKNAFGYAKENSNLVRDSVYWSLIVSSSKKR